MTSHSEAERRKALRRKIDRVERAKEEATLPVNRVQLVALFDHLDIALVDGCDHSLRLTTEFLNSRGLPVATVIPWLRDQGGYCDCEVLANVEERWGNTQ